MVAPHRLLHVPRQQQRGDPRLPGPRPQRHGRLRPHRRGSRPRTSLGEPGRGRRRGAGTPNRQWDRLRRPARSTGVPGSRVGRARPGGCPLAPASAAASLTLMADTVLERAISNYLRHVTIERGLSTNTVAAYRRDLAAYRQLLDDRGVTTPEGISEADVSAFQTELRTRPEGAMTASSMARMLSTVRGFHRFLVDEKVVAVDVAVDAKPPKLAQRL